MNCPYSCPIVFPQPDDVAVHLMDRHGFDYARATSWLRDIVEDGHSPLGCQCEECQWAEAEMKRGNYGARP